MSPSCNQPAQAAATGLLGMMLRAEQPLALQMQGLGATNSLHATTPVRSHSAISLAGGDGLMVAPTPSMMAW